MDKEKIYNEVVQHGHIVYVDVGNDLPPRIIVKYGDQTRKLFIDALWGFVSYETSDHQMEEILFFAKYRSTPVFSGSCHKASFLFTFGKYQAFGVVLDGKQEPIPMDSIRQLSVFALTDAGTMFVSFSPEVEKDAQTLVMGFSPKKRWRTIAQHMAAFWLQMIFKAKN